MKMLNSSMLKILENSHIDTMINVLFDLLIKNREKSYDNYSKTIGLIIKCILKLTKVLSSTMHQINIDKLLLRFHQYVSNFYNESDIGIKAIKTIL